MKSFLSLIAMFLFGTCLSIGLGTGVANAQDDDDGNRIAVNHDEVVYATDPSPMVVYVITRSAGDGDPLLHSPMLHEDIMVLRLPVQRYLIPRSIGKADAISHRWTHGWQARSNC